MKTIYIPYLVMSAGVLFLTWPSAKTQYMEDPTQFYKPMKFDLMLRGQYNISQCIKDLLSCWEYMRADVLCDGNPYVWNFETMCAIDKSYCAPKIGYYDAYVKRFIAFTGFCDAKPSHKGDRGRWT